MPLANVFYSGSLSSQTPTYSVTPGQGTQALMGGLGSLGKTVMDVMTYKPEQDPKRQQARLYQAEAEKTAAQTAREATREAVMQDAGTDLVSSLRAHPERSGEAYQSYFARVSPYLKDPKDFTNTVEALSATLPDEFAASPLVKLMAASGHALSNDQAPTVGMHQQQLADIDARERYKVDTEERGREYAADKQYDSAVQGHKIAADASRYGSDQSAGATIESAKIRAAQDEVDHKRQVASWEQNEEAKRAQASLPVTITEERTPAVAAKNGFFGIGARPAQPEQSVKKKTVGQPPQKLRWDPVSGKLVPQG